MDPSHLPPFRIVESALRVTTTRLVAELHSPTPDAPDWSPFEWSVARAVASLQGISGLLANRLRWSGPEEWRRFIAGQNEHNTARAALAAKTLAGVDALAGQARIPFVALKGSALRVLGVYQPGERPMADIDLLVGPRHVEPLTRLVESIGFQSMYVSRRHAVLTPVGRPPVPGYAEHRDRPLRIELHPCISEELPVEVVDITRLLWPERVVPGCNPYASRGALLLHLLLHASGAMRANALRAIQIHDVATVCRGMRAEDWRGIYVLKADKWWMYPVLLLAEKSFPGSVPSAALIEARARCPRWLQLRMRRASLFDVSWSNPRILALPGIEWSRSLSEALRFARARFFPGRVALDELAQTAVSQPQLMHSGWYEVSHPQRILRWLAGRARRVQTMTSVMAACADSGWAEA